MVQRRSIEVTGMSCDGCERTVRNALNDVGGVRRVEANHATNTVDVVVEDEVSDADIEAAIYDAGFEAGA